MNRSWLLSAVAALPFAAGAQSLDGLKSMVGDPVIGALKSALGVTSSQAEGGLGAMLSLAQEKRNTSMRRRASGP